MTPSPRALAWRCLQRIDHDGAFANLLVPAQLATSGLDQRDRAMVTDLVYGTTRLRRRLDASIDRFIHRQPEPATRSLLRLGAYQLDQGVAAHAAVSETVALAPSRQRGFVNAVLRSISRTPVADWPTEAIRLSVPDWIFDRLSDELGHELAVSAIEAMNRPGTPTVRADGYVQDRGSQWVVDAVGAAVGERILDVCAAPGGKATGMAAGGAFVVGADLQPRRLGLLARNVAALGSDVVAVAADGTRPPFADGQFDAVLLDAPCSGLGALGRRPDARWRVTPGDVDELAALQRAMLTASAALVRPGGRLLYSVCTLLAAESFDHPVPDGWTVDRTPPAGPWQAVRDGWRLTPDVAGTDGMIIIRLRHQG